MMKFAFAAASVLVVASLGIDARSPKAHQLTPDYSYPQYLRDQGKTAPADPSEYATREKLFQAELREVLTHNAKPGILYSKGINQFSDRTAAEKKKMNGGRVLEMAPVAEQLKKRPSYKGLHEVKQQGGALPLPQSFDVRGRSPSIMTAVKNQGGCGSCWTFGTTEAVESYWAAATGDLFVLSEQQVVSCCPNPDQCGGTGGCQGGIFQIAVDYLMQAGGQSEEWYTPYTSFSGQNGVCPKNIGDIKVRLSGYKMIEQNNQAAVMDALVTNNAPIVVNVDASHWSNYEGGVFDGCDYAKNISIDHVVNLVGYGQEYISGKIVKYWTIRNSWSASYGEHGFIRLIRHDVAQCGTCVQNQDGVGCKNDPKTVHTCGACGILYSTGYPIVDTQN